MKSALRSYRRSLVAFLLIPGLAAESSAASLAVALKNQAAALETIPRRVMGSWMLEAMSLPGVSYTGDSFNPIVTQDVHHTLARGALKEMTGATSGIPLVSRRALLRQTAMAMGLGFWLTPEILAQRRPRLPPRPDMSPSGEEFSPKELRGWLDRLLLHGLPSQQKALQELQNIDAARWNQIVIALATERLGSDSYRERGTARQLLRHLAMDRGQRLEDRALVSKAIQTGFNKANKQGTHPTKKQDASEEEKQDTRAHLIRDGAWRLMLRVQSAWGWTQIQFAQPRFRKDAVEILKRAVNLGYEAAFFQKALSVEAKDDLQRLADEMLTFLESHPIEAVVKTPLEHRHFLTLAWAAARLAASQAVRPLSQNDYQNRMNTFIELLDAESINDPSISKLIPDPDQSQDPGLRPDALTPTPKNRLPAPTLPERLNQRAA